ncbi:cytochrome P450 [Streptomyces sp. URMC 124]|uniref:cytochrome P450 n=1 Tax=Streptomyces sp. URMC 124 TaxID=3423405 RepID=UPI003F1C919C
MTSSAAFPATLATAPGAMPLVGHAIPLLRSPLSFLNGLAGLGDLVRIKAGPFTVLVVCDPDLTHEVLVNDHLFDKGGPIFERAREVVGNSLITCPHTQHRRQRRLTQPAFHHSRMDGYGKVMTEQTARTLRGWRDGQEINVTDAMMELNARITAAAMFGGSLPDTTFRQVVADLHTVFNGMYWRAFTPPGVAWLLAPFNRRYDAARRRLRASVARIIADHRRRGDDQGDLLSMLIATRTQQDGALTDHEIADQVVAFFVAGAETTGATVAWALHALTRHPQVEEALHAEADEVLGGRTARFEDLPRLDLTGRVIRETLRRYSPVWMLTRTVTRDTTLGGHAVKGGSAVMYSHWIIHHRSDLYEEPYRFDPGRWAADAAPIRREAVIPFGAGPHKCIGDVFALQAMTIQLATLAGRWRMRPVPGKRVRPRPVAVLKPDGLVLRAVSRTGEAT